ncbi:MAG: glycosyltransferase family 2 protein [Pseudomonadota bacterium]
MLISVCLCTYKRDTLQKTLQSIADQSSPDDCTLEVVVVDNDEHESGRATCSAFADSALDVRYFVNSQRNLSAVRNATMEHAHGDLLAFIDDDEWADPHWIAALYEALQHYQADAVFGPVKVHYPDETPEWIRHGDMFGKDKHETGAQLKKGATSNALLKASWVKQQNYRFDPAYGKSGGEDTDFFHRIYKGGGKLVFDNRAIVSETVEPHRLNMDYLKRQNIRIGQTHWNYLWSQQSGLSFVKTGLFVVAQVVGAAGLMLITLPFGKKRYAKWYLRLVRNLVKIKTAVSGGESVELYGNG